MKESPGTVARHVATLLKELRQAIERQDSVAICEAGRDLVYEAIATAYDYEDVWTEKVKEEGLKLLKDGAIATEGTPEQENCAERPEAFRSFIEKAEKARMAWVALEKAVGV